MSAHQQEGPTGESGAKGADAEPFTAAATVTKKDALPNKGANTSRPSQETFNLRPRSKSAPAKGKKPAADDAVNDAPEDRKKASSDTDEEWKPDSEKRKRKAVTKKYDLPKKGAKMCRPSEKTVNKKDNRPPKKNAPTKGKKPLATKKSVPANVKKWLSTKDAQIKEDTAKAVDEPDYDSEDTANSPITDLTNRMIELDVSVSNTFEGALNSSDTHLGAELLTFAATFSQRVPNERLCKVLLDLIMFGPNSGGTWFPDCQRMELATNYMSLLLSKPGFTDKLSRLAKPSFWEECLDQMTAPIYCVDGDECRISAAAIERTGQSLHVKVCCAELFLDLLSRELKGFVRNNDVSGPDPDHDTDRTESIFSKPIVKHIQGRTKEALEKSLKACTQLWNTYGHFICCDLPDLETAMEAKDGPSPVSVHFVRSQACRLVKVMGSLCSYLAWLYGFDASESTRSLAILIDHHAPKELEETTFDPAPFLDVTDYSKEVRLNFMLNLDKRCVPKLRPMLAEMLGVASKYNAIFG
jgi:hypothetical protein